MVTVTAAYGVNQHEVEKFGPYKKWFDNLNASLKLQKEQSSHKFHADPYELEKIDIQATKYFTLADGSQRLGFVFVDALIKNKGLGQDGKPTGKPKEVAGSAFLRGDSVVMMIVVQPEGAKGDDEAHVIMTIQPRAPAGSLAFTEFPAGMVDGGTFKGAAVKEVEEETGLKITGLINMSEAGFKKHKPAAQAWKTLNAKAAKIEEELDENLAQGFYMSVGGSDEVIQAFYARMKLPKAKFDELNGKETGVVTENEQITLKLVPLDEVLWECQRDAKSLATLALYQNLKAKGLLA